MEGILPSEKEDQGAVTGIPVTSDMRPDADQLLLDIRSAGRHKDEEDDAPGITVSLPNLFLSNSRSPSIQAERAGEPARKKVEK